VATVHMDRVYRRQLLPLVFREKTYLKLYSIYLGGLGEVTL